MGERRGELEVETAGGVAREDRAALETLADQVALALETVARAREKADAERRHVRDLFSRFVPEAVVEEVLAQADGARLGGRALDGHDHVHRPARLHDASPSHGRPTR